uniref:EF-hand domain-containing protein n=1 Tax=Lotharella globosa TaxID=91324 RepID=A0A7S3Z7J9_9EUKA|mmetsp:Transcript_35214/g.68099  ORF Transcript_35214/g.68099 Transcript_35214/m.68099 type:complete len:256 (+) Transcript_35214:46-813(+)
MTVRAAMNTKSTNASPALNLSRPNFKSRPSFLFRVPSGNRQSSRLAVARRSIVLREKNGTPAWTMMVPQGERRSERLHCLREGLKSGLPVLQGFRTSAPIARAIPMHRSNIQGVSTTQNVEGKDPIVTVEPTQHSNDPVLCGRSGENQVIAEVLFGEEAVKLPKTPRLAHKEMKKLFESFTKDSDVICRQDFKSAIGGMGRRPKASNINAAFVGLDQDGNGTIEYEEFADKVGGICFPSNRPSAENSAGTLLYAR